MKSYLLGFLVIVLAPPVWGAGDPMRPIFFDAKVSGEKTSTAKPLMLSMILHANDRQVAVINGRSVKVGDSVSGYRVMAIKKNQVVVARRGKTKKIALGKPKQRNKIKVANRSIAAEN